MDYITRRVGVTRRWYTLRDTEEGASLLEDRLNMITVRLGVLVPLPAVPAKQTNYA